MATQIDHYLTPDLQRSQKEKTADSAGYVTVVDDEYIIVGDTSEIGMASAEYVYTEYRSKSMYWLSKNEGKFYALPKTNGHKTILKVVTSSISHSGSSSGQTSDGYDIWSNSGSTTVTQVREGKWYSSSKYFRYSTGNQVVKDSELQAFGEVTSLFTSMTSTERSRLSFSGTWYWVPMTDFIPARNYEVYGVKLNDNSVVKAKWTGTYWKKASDDSSLTGVRYFAINSSYVTSVSSAEKQNVH